MKQADWFEGWFMAVVAALFIPPLVLLVRMMEWADKVWFAATSRRIIK